MVLCLHDVSFVLNMKYFTESCKLKMPHGSRSDFLFEKALYTKQTVEVFVEIHCYRYYIGFCSKLATCWTYYKLISRWWECQSKVAKIVLNRILLEEYKELKMNQVKNLVIEKKTRFVFMKICCKSALTCVEFLESK